MKEVNKNRKEEVLSHHSEVNVDEIWAAIEPQVDIINAEKKRRKGLLFFFLLGAILVTSAGLYLWQTDAQIAVSNAGIKTETSNIKTITEENPQQLKEEATGKTYTQETDNQIIADTKEKQITTEEALKEITTSSSIAPTTSSNTSVEKQSNPITKTKSTSISNSNKTINNSFKNETLSQQINTNKIAFSDETLSSPELSFPQENSKPKPPKSITPSPQISSLNLKMPTLIPDVGEVSLADEEEDKRLANDLNFAISAHTGISFINRGLASNIDSVSSPELLRLRRESETMLEAIHYGLRAKLKHKSGISFSTGGQYTVLSERYDNNNLEMESDSVDGIVKRIIQLNGDTVDILGRLPRTTTYDYEKQIYNRYKMIDVPFIIGYEGGMKDWSLGIQAGVFVNLALKTSGKIRNTSTEDIDIGENQADIFKSKLGLSYYGGIYIRRALSQNLDVTIAPHGRFFAKDFNVDSYSLKQRYSLIGVQAGLSYRF